MFVLAFTPGFASFFAANGTAAAAQIGTPVPALGPTGRIVSPEELAGNSGSMVTLPAAALMLATGSFDYHDVKGQLFFSDLRY